MHGRLRVVAHHHHLHVLVHAIPSRPSQDQPVGAAEGGNHDSDRHDRRPGVAEDDTEGSRGHSVIRGLLDPGERQRH